jgi:hypothetical protein
MSSGKLDPSSTRLPAVFMTVASNRAILSEPSRPGTRVPGTHCPEMECRPPSCWPWPAAFVRPRRRSLSVRKYRKWKPIEGRSKPNPKHQRVHTGWTVSTNGRTETSQQREDDEKMQDQARRVQSRGNARPEKAEIVFFSRAAETLRWRRACNDDKSDGITISWFLRFYQDGHDVALPNGQGICVTHYYEFGTGSPRGPASAARRQSESNAQREETEPAVGPWSLAFPTVSGRRCGAFCTLLPHGGGRSAETKMKVVMVVTAAAAAAGVVVTAAAAAGVTAAAVLVVALTVTDGAAAESSSPSAGGGGGSGVGGEGSGRDGDSGGEAKEQQVSFRAEQQRQQGQTVGCERAFVLELALSTPVWTPMNREASRSARLRRTQRVAFLL